MFLQCFALLISSVVADVIDNSIVGRAEVDCGSENITLGFNTKLPFEGRVYVKGLNANKDCRFVAKGNLSAATVVMPMDSCGVRRSRSLNPAGMSVSLTIVVSFHPKFETGADQAFRLSCFYMESSVTVDTSLDVSLMSTSLMEATAKGAHDSLPMPVCSYEILDSNKNGHNVKHAAVGQLVHHRWHCDSVIADKFCMAVHSCVVEDGKGDKLELLDSRGCALDKRLMDNLEYTEDLVAYRSTHVFSYADRVAVYFQCQIDLFAKDQLKCPRPNCLITRETRSVGNHSAYQSHKFWVLDVASEINALDHFYPPYYSEYHKRSDRSREDFCLSSVAFYNFSTVLIVVFLVTFVSFWLVVYKLCCGVSLAERGRNERDVVSFLLYLLVYLNVILYAMAIHISAIP